MKRSGSSTPKKSRRECLNCEKLIDEGEAHPTFYHYHASCIEMMDADAKARFKQSHKYDVQEEPGYKSKWNPGDIRVLPRTKENIPPEKRWTLITIRNTDTGVRQHWLIDLWEEEKDVGPFSGYPDALSKQDELNGKPNRYGNIQGGPLL